MLTADLPSKVITSSIDGAARYRKEIQAFSCTGSAGSLVISWRGSAEITVAATDTLATLATTISALTSVTVAGVDDSPVCSGELVYVTFEEVSSFDPAVVQLATTNSNTTC